MNGKGLGRKSKNSQRAQAVQATQAAQATELVAAEQNEAAAFLGESKDWVELFPSGISFGNGGGRPVLVLKDRHQVEVLPVWMHPLDAAVGLQELSTGSGATPHSVTRRILEALEVRIESCAFVELTGHHQYVALRFAGSDKLKALKVRADEAMSFCLQGKARFFSTKEFMARCRDMDESLSELEGNLGKGSLAALQAEREIVSKKHPYVM